MALKQQKHSTYTVSVGIIMKKLNHTDYLYPIHQYRAMQKTIIECLLTIDYYLHMPCKNSL